MLIGPSVCGIVSFFTSNDDCIGRLQGPITFEVGTRPVVLSCIIDPLTLLHRIFVVAQFVFVASQSLQFVLMPIS